LHHEFEWDGEKARSNAKKHGVTFDQAAEVLRDEAGDSLHLEEYDELHLGGEDRFVTTASHPGNRDLLLVICWTERDSARGTLTRILSARRATLAEGRRYEAEIG
jgi:uncharacterized DUF497 family protein